MKIKGVDGLSLQQVQEEVSRGGKFVVFSYCFSIVVMSFKRPTDIYFIRADQNAFLKSLPWTVISLLVGWWGIPWGIIYTFSSLFNNIKGGRNVSTEVLQSIQRNANAPLFEFEAQAATA
jgi:hypothetical protein